MKSYSFTTGGDGDHDEVLRLSQAMDLDVQNFCIRDFCVVRKGTSIVGFGRLRAYTGFREVATVGVVEEERSRGVGSEVVKRLLEGKQEAIYLTCVIPGFFSRLGFAPVREFPTELIAKYDFCRSFGYSESEVHVMKYNP
ncbi:MAG: GNAT family N-acetyltransferase [Bacteroidia bacterium]|nr:GNAT family N-acetyltransferase [Bacteroidia bacterium]